MSYSVFSPIGFSPKSYTVDSAWKAVEKTQSWQAAVLLISASILVTGIAFMIISSLIPASPAAFALSMVGLRFLEIGTTSTAVSAIALCITTLFHKKKKSAKTFAQDLSEHIVSTNPQKNVETTNSKKTK